MMIGLRLIRIAGLLAVALAALTAAGERAFAQTITGISPSFGSISGGTPVTISGTGFTTVTVTSVTIGGAALTNLTVVNDFEITGTTTSDGTLPAPTVSLISPNHGGTGGGTSVIITGANFADLANVVVNWSGGSAVALHAFTYDAVTGVSIGGTTASFTPTATNESPTTIALNTPPGVAGVANVVVTTPFGNSGSSGNNLYAYTPGGPSVSAIGPTFGLTSGGNTITITGSNFVPGKYANGSSATTATIGGAQVTSLSVTSTTSLTGTAPAGTAGAADVQVTTPDSTKDGGYLYLYEAPATPVVASVSCTSPAPTCVSSTSGTVAGGSQVTISGSNFTGATSVTFGGVAVNSFNVTGPGTITTATPAHAAGAVSVVVTVTAPGGPYVGTGANLFTYVTPLPTVTSISPNSGSTAGGTAVTITGQYLTGATAVTIGGTEVTSFNVVSDTQINATTAAHAAGTGLNVQVTTPSGTGTGANLFTYGTPVPTVSSVSPSGGSVAGGTAVTITGQYFTGATTVTFGGTAATNFNVVNDGEITATTPAHSAGIVNVAVTTAVGTGTGANLYTYGAQPPTVTAISPSSGSTLGGTSVTITGTNFTGTPQVTIGGVAAAEVTVVNSTTITAVTPAGTGKNVPVIVTTSFGSSAAANIYSYVAPTPPSEPAPTVTGVTPNTGTTLGGTPVTITGTNFTGATSVTFGGNAATNVVVVSPTSITALTPPGSGVVNVAVTTPGGTGAGPALYTYVTVAPTVIAVTPNTGTTLGGTSVTITGTNFTGATAVTFGGNAATNITVLTATTLTATTPAGAAGLVNVAVTTPAGTGTGPNLYTYVAQSLPTVTAISPNGGSIANGGNTAGGTQVTITGTNFTGATSVTIGGNAATFMTVVNSTTITAITPAHAPGLVNVAVTTPAGTGTGANLFTYVEGPPTVTAISPTSGTTLGGTFVTITGTNFTGATLVTIGGNAPSSVTFVNATTITATTTAHAPGPVNVAVTTPAGTGVGTNLFTYVSPAPAVTAVSPNTGPPGGGTSVTITGSNFTGATAVMFGGANATLFTVNSPTSITATSPLGSGTVNVTVTTPAGTSPAVTGDQFTYVPKATTTLTLTSSPNPSSYGQAVTFTAKVTGNSPTGTVTFSEGGKQIGTATLSNITATSSTATFTTASLPVGSDAVTASYSGDANNLPDPTTVIQTVNVPADSVKLRQMQLAAMPVAANMSGQAVSSAIDSAIAAGFSGRCPAAPTPNGAGLTYCFNPEPQPQQVQLSSASDRNDAALLPSPLDHAMLDHDFKALGYADAPPGFGPPPRAAPSLQPSNWLAWIDFRATSFDRTPTGNDLTGWQANATTGLTHRFTEDFLVGVAGGYEHFDYSSQAYNGVLRGDGWTGGAYLAWRLTPTLRFEAAGTWSDILAADTAGSASGNFTGTRWLAFGGLIGTYGWQGVVLEPSAQVFTLWEHDNAYTDSLGTLQPNHDFDTGRASGGLKISYPFATSFGGLAPYLGIYGDYYFSMDNAATAGLTTVPLLQGWAARATGGLTATFGGGAQIGAGAEFSGIGNDTHIWTAYVRGSVPF